jgi:uncharacterized protein with von Willebrand factor type A (vWA) domain
LIQTSSRFLDNLLIFGRLLRHEDLEIHMGRMLDVAEALPHVDLGSREEVHATCRTLLIHRHEDFATFDRVFDAFWDGVIGGADPKQIDAASPPGKQHHPEGARGASSAGGEDVAGAGVLRTWSDAEAIKNKDFAALTADELALARAAIARLSWQPGERRTRRWVKGRGPRIDLGRALANSLRTSGEIVTLPRRRRRRRPRPLVLVCDVSGSMERYSRTLLHFAHTLMRRSSGLEAFVFSTRLTRVTRALRASHPDAAIKAAAQSVQDWSGGTRIGAALKTFHQRWRRRILHRGPVVLLISDGWDRGDAQVLREEVARLQRSCHRLIWLNPLIGTVGFEPLTYGLQSALPYVDDFLPVRTLRDVRDLAAHLGTLARQA